MDYQIINMLKSIHYHLHSLRSIRNLIQLSIDIFISSSYILSLFDYCNNPLFNIPVYKLNKLQTLQNEVARLWIPITPSLHWLKPTTQTATIIYLIKYKLSIITHKVIHHNSSQLPHTPTTNNTITRSSNTFFLDTHSITCSRAFTLSAPYNWNSLPASLRTISSTISFKP